jgi:enamine deaminase RidA (YjgF/YER057c/UK114 family)
MSIEAKLQELNLSLPTPPKPVASYVPCVRTGNLVVVSGQLPSVDGKLLCTGKVPSAVDLDRAQQCARQCVLNGLANLKAELGGDWSKLVRVVRVGGFVACDDDYTAQPQVINGASDLLVQLLGDAGRHARAAVGVNALPLGAPVEIEFTFEVR